MTPEQETVLVIKGSISELPAEYRKACELAAEQIRAVVANAGEVGLLALALVGAESHERVAELADARQTKKGDWQSPLPAGPCGFDPRRAHLETMNEMPNCPQVDYCHCYPEEERQANARGATHCVCGESEKALRGWLNKRITTPMTPEQREWCYGEIDQVEWHDRKDYEQGTDAELAVGVLGAWQSYCDCVDKGLL